MAAYLGLIRHSATHFIAALNAGASSSFIKHFLLPYELQKRIRPLESQIKRRDASNRLVSIAGTLKLSVNVGSQSTNVKFYVVERVGTDLVLSCDFCDAHAEAIRPGKREIELADGSTVPIMQTSQKRSIDLVSVPKEQECITPKSPSNHNIIASNTEISH